MGDTAFTSQKIAGRGPNGRSPEINHLRAWPFQNGSQIRQDFDGGNQIGIILPRNVLSSIGEILRKADVTGIPKNGS